MLKTYLYEKLGNYLFPEFLKPVKMFFADIVVEEREMGFLEWKGSALMTFPAHIRFDGDKKVVQTVDEHCRACAKYASELIIKELRNTAYLAGLLHDLGKYTFAFKDYITRASQGEAVKRGSVNHTFAGVRFVLEQWRKDPDLSIRNMTCEIIASAIGSHHGLFDCIGPGGKDGFNHRVEKEDIGYLEAKENFLRYCAQLKELDQLFEEAYKEVLAIISVLKKFGKEQSEIMFYISLLTRMVFSAVIDADRRDTCEFKYGVNQDLAWIKKTAKPKWQDFLQDFENKINTLQEDSPINKARKDISVQCGLGASEKGGIYTLSVPTGAGKTLASLRYCLASAAKHEKKRIFYVIPLLSVLEQNASVIRKYINDDKMILEHHSNIIQEKEESEHLDENVFFMETWSAPLIITTLVQFLNTLFSGKTSSIRRMNSLSQSIIVIDEVQSVPRKMLSLFNLAINFLAYTCEATVVLCSATQPCLESAARPIVFKDKDHVEIIPYSPQLWEVFRRTEIIDRRKIGGWIIEDLANFVLECMNTQGSVLMICNTKAQARSLYDLVVPKTSEAVYHLSTSMCMAHRIKTMEEIKKCLDSKRPVICISTQLVEAGVDFSFACVIRVMAGMDNVVQAAGRCNRSGEMKRLCPVYIVNIQGENLKYLQEIKASQKAAGAVLNDFLKNPTIFHNDLASEDSVRAYYESLYNDMIQKQADFQVGKYSTTIYELLSENPKFWNSYKGKERYYIPQAFKTAGEAFTVFDSNTVDVLVPYGFGSELIAELTAQENKKDWHYCRKLLEQGKKYTISLFAYGVDKLWQSGGIYSIWDNTILVLMPNYYANDAGLNFDDEIGILEV